MMVSPYITLFCRAGPVCPAVGAEQGSPSHGFAVPAPFRQGGRGRGLPRARCALAMTEVERICVSFRDQSADWSWESVIPLYKRRGERIATASVRTGFAMTHYKKCGEAGRCGERTERCRWQRKRSERVAAVKILSVRRKAAQKFWAPQQDHRPLRNGL